MTERIKYIFNPVFLISIAILLLNDYLLKDQFHNWLTGKLSDATGIVVFVLFLSVFVSENLRSRTYLFSAAIFVFWKSEWSSGLIDTWNYTIPFWRLSRVVDYTDFFCLLILIPLYRYAPIQIQFGRLKKLVVIPTVLITLFAVAATSKGGYSKVDQVDVDEFFTVKMSRSQLLNQLEKDRVNYRQDSTYIFKKNTYDRYILTNIVLSRDTISRATIGIHDKKRKVIVYVDRIVFANEKIVHFVDYKDFEKWSKQYKMELENFIEQ